MHCSNCGKHIPFFGKVCPWCHTDKTADKVGTALAMIGGIAGCITGVTLFGAFWPVVGCTLAGMFPGACVAALCR